MEEPAEGAGLDESVEALHRGRVAPVEAGHPGALGSRGRLDHRAALGRVHGERVLAEDMTTCGEGFERDLVVQHWRRRDDQYLGLGLYQQVLPAGKDAWDPVPVSDGAGGLVISLRDGHHLAA